MTWTGQTFTAGQVLTATQMNNLQDDITAQANGDSGAPKNKLASMDSNSVDSSQIVASAVSQGKLSTALGEVSTASSSANLTLPGGEYGFYPQVKTTSGSTHLMYIGSGISNTSFVTNIYIQRQSGSGTGYAQQRYVQASPPYDLGDGPIPLFVFLLIKNATGKILQTYIAPEAPWHLNGPTIISPDDYIDGRPYRKIYRVPDNVVELHEQVKIIRQKLRDGDAIDDSERLAMRNFYLAIANQPSDMQEITQAIKNADMDLLPHPFNGHDTVNESVVLVDPLSPILEKLLDLIQYEGAAFETTRMFMRGFFTIDNTPLQRAGPAGVMQVGFNWRSTP